MANSNKIIINPIEIDKEFDFKCVPSVVCCLYTCERRNFCYDPQKIVVLDELTV